IPASLESSKRRTASLKDSFSSRIAARTDSLKEGLKILLPFLGSSPDAPWCSYTLNQSSNNEYVIPYSLDSDFAERYCSDICLTQCNLNSGLCFFFFIIKMPPESV